MGRPPAVVIVTRHGARLDAADSHWHLTSPAPYNSPLTYSGWTQCRSLGGKIASLLRARELLFEQTVKDTAESNQAQTNGSEAKHDQDLLQRRKKHRIIIHSSPFLRCVQTSVAIAAGISQYRDFDEGENNAKTPKPAQTSTPPNKSGQARLASIEDEDEARVRHASGHADSVPYFKPRLRIDAFLGEWLTPDYYESITPPPNSVLMVATAKAELLHRGEHIQMPEDSKRNPSVRGNFPGGWGSRPGSSSGSPVPDADELGKKLADTDINQFSTMSRTRSRTQGDITNSHERTSRLDHMSTAREKVGYVPPIPPYAVSPSEPIPAGYVQHARDACVDVDFQWDSMRAPQDWGDGGELGEEWSAMHKRFRKGLHSMVSWYALHHESALQSQGRSRVLHPHPQEPDDEDTDLVVVLVTHGAGCNALIGALTNQPVLLDVAMASLTMAVTRDRPDAAEGPRTSYAPISPSLPRYPNERPLSSDYIVTLTASTDHLTHDPFTPVSLRDLQSQPRIPSESSVSRRSSRRRYIPAPVVAGHDRAASLSQLPTNLDSPRFGISRSNTGSTDSGNSVASGPSVQPRSTPNGMASSVGTAAMPSAAPPTSVPGLWSRPGTREGGGASHPRTWSLLSQSSTASDSDAVGGSSRTGLGAAAGAAGGWMVASPTTIVAEQIGSILAKTGPEEPRRPPTSAPSQEQTSPQTKHKHKHTTSAAIASDSESNADNSRPPSPPSPPLHRLRTIDSDDITERDRGAKRRWTTSQSELELERGDEL